MLKISDEIMMMLDDHVQTTQQISFSPFKAAFEDRITEWDNKLKLIQDVTFYWIEVQKCVSSRCFFTLV